MKKAVIFDLDGLLIDSEVISHRLYDELLHRYGKSVTVAEYARDYSGKTGVANMTNVIARYNLPITVEEGLTWEAAREKELLQDVQLKPGAAIFTFRTLLRSSSPWCWAPFFWRP